jgi:hypothetical protein
VKKGSRQATATITMDLDGIMADSPELTKTVQDLVATNTKSLQAQVTRLTNKLNKIQDSKYQSSGTDKSSTRSKKKMDSSQHNTVRSNPKVKTNTQKAVAAANNSNASSKNKKLHGKGKRKNKKKSTPTNSNSE